VCGCPTILRKTQHSEVLAVREHTHKKSCDVCEQIFVEENCSLTNARICGEEYCAFALNVFGQTEIAIVISFHSKGVVVA